MEAFIGETMRRARAYFAGLGFSDAQVEALLASGERDLRKELAKIAALLIETPPDEVRLNQALHALKGLLLNMGSHEAAETFTEFRTHMQRAGNIDAIKKLLGLA